ncbi:phage holin family protein [Variovorax sp. RHLX14]|uniref:phage holin family protein n=1 Tax=Variovorax sp. RHLX14 TaxID=1259731 RepID=UPI003F4615F3
MKKLLSFLGLDARIRRVRIAAGEGALAVEDRAQLLRMAWHDEKQRLKSTVLLVVAVLALTTVTVALVSVAVVVNFWDTSYRVTAAWSVAGVWVLLWLAAVLSLIGTLRGASGTLDTTQKTFERDWEWLQNRLSVGKGTPTSEDAPRPRRPATRDELLARIDRQRQRVAVMKAARDDVRPEQGKVPANETPKQTAIRLARAHPVATGVAAAVVIAVVKPGRLLRWSALLAPILWRIR